MDALLTGGTGFLGSYLLPLLEENYDKVYLITRKTNIEENENLRIINADIQNLKHIKDKIKNIDHIYHSAAKVASFPKDINAGFIQTNVMGTQNMLQLAERLSISKFIYTSSFFALGPVENEIADETHNKRTEINHPYVQTKFIAGKIIEQYNNENFDIVTLNPTTIIGPGINNSISKAIVDYCNGKLPGLPNGGNNFLNFVLPDKVAEAHVLASKYGKNKEKYIIGGENMTLFSLLSNIGSLINKKPPRDLPVSLIKIYIKLQEFFTRNPQISFEDFLISIEDWKYTSGKAIKNLHYSHPKLDDKNFILPLLDDFSKRGLLKKKIKNIINNMHFS